jgi:peptidyl-prolyl cis-trans isomerase B (cyclophilin B)
MRAHADTRALTAACVLLCVVSAAAELSSQSQPAVAVNEVAVLAAEEQRAATARDLAVLRAGVHTRDIQTARVAIRAVGRLNRPDLIGDLVTSLGSAVPEIRAEAANAIAQAAQGWATQPPTKGPTRAALDRASAALVSRLTVENDADVRAALADAMGRLPYGSIEQIDNAEQTLLDFVRRSQLPADRLGIVQGFVALMRQRTPLGPPTDASLELLRVLATVSIAPQSDANHPAAQAPATLLDPAKDARVRRLAMEALATARAVDGEVIRHAAADPDAQVRRLAMRAMRNAFTGPPEAAAAILAAGLTDPSPMVRLAALTASPGRLPCGAVVEAEHDQDLHVAIAALDQLAGCADSDEAVRLLERTAADSLRSEARGLRHRRAHALVALAVASPSKAADLLPGALGSRASLIRAGAARAATVLKDRASLERLARDDDDQVRRVAVGGLAEVAGHEGDAVYLTSLDANDPQVVRVAALALARTTAPTAVEALKAALSRLSSDERPGSIDAQKAVLSTLRDLGVAAPSDPRPRPGAETAGLTVPTLRRLAATRARVTIAGLGAFDLALIAGEAPLSVLRFVRLANARYYDGLMLQVAPSLVMQAVAATGREPAADVALTNDEVGRWPHVRGAVGFSARAGDDVDPSQLLIDLVDHPELDHQYPVFAHVLNGMDVLDEVLDGDIIDKIEILDR